ncbi:MAG TPA: segregation/condensation protein A [Caldilineae bacterium]|nr:segregation/condensation protein A [Caldilineae bacterium]
MSDPLNLRPIDNYVVQLEVFQGPMDLLLHLIEKEELPITSVSLAGVTAQYLDYLEQLEQLQPDGIAEFLVMAARLLYIKSVALLPQVALEEDEEEDPGEALARQLREYKRFKEKAGFLRELEESGRRSYVRTAPPPKLETHLDPEGLDAALLMEAVYEVLMELEAAPPPIHAIEPLKITVEERVEHLWERLRTGETIRFRQYLRKARSRTEIVVSFMAVLEMIKQSLVQVQQSELFGDIVIERIPDANPGDDLLSPPTDAEPERQ